MATIEPIPGRTFLPGARPFTVDDLFNLPDDGNRYELFNGSLVVSPSPSLPHQDAIFRLQMILHQAAPSQFRVYHTVNVRASDKDLYIPDLVVIPKDVAKSVRLMLAPSDVLLVVEVASPSTKAHDRGTKVQAYAEAGIPLYWRVELTDGPILYVYELDGDSYREPVAYKPGTDASLATPYPVTFDPGELMEDWGNPPLLEA